MEIEDGVIWVYGVGEDGVLAFTDFGIESLIELIKMYKDDPTLLKRWDRSEWPPCGLRRRLTLQAGQSRTIFGWNRHGRFLRRPTTSATIPQLKRVNVLSMR